MASRTQGALRSWSVPEGESGIPDEAVVTQAGVLRSRAGRWSRHTFSFRAALRQERSETYMSVILGRLPVEETVPMICRGDAAGAADAVRYTEVGTLRAAGFEVSKRPSRTIPNHSAVSWPSDWTPDVALKFDACFVDLQRGPERGDLRIE